jgi:hypothetical protein
MSAELYGSGNDYEPGMLLNVMFSVVKGSCT